MGVKSFVDKLLSKLNWRPLQVFLKHYHSAERDLSSVAVAYYLLLTTYPLIIIAANIFPYLNIDISDLLTFMRDNLPSKIYSSVASITTMIFLTPSSSILGVATVTALWTMSKSLTSLQKAVNKAYGVSQHRDFVVGRLVGIFLGLLILFLLTFVLLVSTFIQAAIKVINNFYDLTDRMTNAMLNLSQPVTILTVVFGLMILYFVLPNVRIKRLRYISPGTIFTSLVIICFNNLFSQYVLHTFERMADIKVFGSVVILVLMLWFIFIANVIIIGAVINASYQELRQGKLESRSGDILSFIKRRQANKSSDDPNHQNQKKE